MQNPRYIKCHFMRDLWDLLFEWNPFLEMIWRFKRKRNPALRVFAPGMGRFFFRSCCCLYSSSTKFEFLHKNLDWLGHFLKKSTITLVRLKKDIVLTKAPDYLLVKPFNRVDISYRFLFLFSFDRPGTKNQILNTKCKLIFFFLPFQFKKRRGQPGLFCFWFETTTKHFCWHLLFSHWLIKWKDHWWPCNSNFCSGNLDH